MAALLTEQQLGELLTSFQRTAFRFETRDRYNSDVGRESFRRFLAGEPDDHAWHRPWLEMIRSDRRRGKRWMRVRIVSVPVSEWTRYAMQVARLSIAAGDDIRYLSRTAAKQLGLEPYDAWLLDDERLVCLCFDDSDDTFKGAEVVIDGDVVQRHRAWRDLAWQHAQTLVDFVASLP